MNNCWSKGCWSKGCCWLRTCYRSDEPLTEPLLHSNYITCKMCHTRYTHRIDYDNHIDGCLHRYYNHKEHHGSY